MKNIQYILLRTDDGTAYSKRVLKSVWNQRLKECHATHYKIVDMIIIERE